MAIGPAVAMSKVDRVSDNNIMFMGFGLPTDPQWTTYYIQTAGPTATALYGYTNVTPL